jgi:hypothetical protein
VKARLVELPSNVSSPPHCCIVTGRTDEPVIDFGDPTAKAQGPNDPRIYIRRSVIEKTAKDLLGMVPEVEVAELRERLDALETRNAELAERVAAVEGLRQAAELVIEVTADDPDDPDADDGAGQPKE